MEATVLDLTDVLKEFLQSMRCAFIESDVTSVLIKIKLTAGRGEAMLMCVLVDLETIDNSNQIKAFNGTRGRFATP